MTDPTQIQNNNGEEAFASAETGSIFGTKEESEDISEEKRALLIAMAKAGVFYGRRKSKTHPRMKQFVYATRNGIEIIDIAQTLDHLNAAVDFLRKAIQEGGILVVGTQPSIKAVIENFAKNCKLYFVIERWIGGLLTNFKIIRTRIEYFIKMKEDKESGRLDQYTKKERLRIDRELEKMENMFGGVRNMSSLPKALLVIDPVVHTTAVREAVKLGIPIVAAISTDGDPEKIAYPIPANTNAKASVEWILNYIYQQLTTNDIINHKS